MQFNLAGRVQLILESQGHAGYDRYFENEYRRVSQTDVPAQRATSVTVRIVKHFPPIESGDIRRDVRCKKLFTFHYVVRQLHTEHVVIYFKRHFLDSLYMNAIAVFLQAQVLEPIIYLKLLQQGVLLMHAGGVCDGNHGYIFPAYGGTGKTTFSIALLGHGYQLLGDDLLMIDIERGIVHPYPRPLHLFTYNINSLHGATVPAKYRIAIYLKNVLRYFLERALNTEFLISTRVHADKLFPHDPFGTSVPVAGIFFLVRDGAPISLCQIDASNINQLAEEIMDSADLNTSLYDLLSDTEEIENTKRLERHAIIQLLNRFDILTKVNTRKLDLADLGSFIHENFVA